MNDFKWKHFRGEIILGCVRWYNGSGLGESCQAVSWKNTSKNERI